MEVIFLVGRILFAIVFVGAGANHLREPKGMSEYVGARGVPSPEEATLASGPYLIVAGLSVALGIWADLGALLIAAFTLATAFLVHHFWTDEGQEQQQSMNNFLKDVALAGGALMLFALFAKFGDDVGLTVTGPLFDL
ncbi:MAG TPA: DoxX family protein [Acidimicrobiales bacterium]|jgi:uncharacterized membrane protein YphA (DoxX/SURF4 family)|nr:DoxX family protein [Acidimicrobiales bacterium]